MLFSIDRDTLLTNLLIIQKGLPNKTPLPILYAIKFEVNEKNIVLTSSNNEISTQVIIEDKSLDIKKTGKVAISGKFLIDIIRKVTSQKIEIALIEKKIIVIKAERSEFKLKLVDLEDYPVIDFITNEKNLILDSKTLKEIIRETNYAAATNEKRPILTGVNFKFKDNTLSCVATDSYRLSQKIIKIKADFDFDFVIPNKSLDELNKVLELTDDNVKIYVSSSKVLFQMKNILFQTTLLEGNYPNTQRIIPVEFPVSIDFNKEELLSAVERVSLLSPRDRETNYNIIKLTLRNDQVIEINSTNNEIGEATEEIIPTSQVKYNSIFKISFSSKHLLEALKTFESPEITISFSGEVKPFIIKTKEDKNILHLILPVRID